MNNSEEEKYKTGNNILNLLVSFLWSITSLHYFVLSKIAYEDK